MATPEIEAELKKATASRRFAEVAEGLSNMVYEQPTSLKPVADQYKLAIQQSGWFSRNAGASGRAFACSSRRRGKVVCKGRLDVTGRHLERDARKKFDAMLSF